MPEVGRGDENDGKYQETDQGEFPVHDKEYDRNAKQKKDVFEEHRDDGGKKLVQILNIAGHARHQPSNRILGKKSHGKLLDVPKKS